MISVQDADAILAHWVRSHRVLQIKEINIDDALGLVLAKDLFSPLSMPCFDNAAMDGYAIKSCDTIDAATNHPVRLKVAGYIKAGAASATLSEGMSCIKIMTGAILPKGADAVVKKEDVTEIGEEIILKDKVKSGENIRLLGEDILSGALALKAGTLINPGVISFLASIGFRRVPVNYSPKVGLVVTGDELVSDISQLKEGKIPDSNSHTLISLLREDCASVVSVVSQLDNAEELAKVLVKLFDETNLILITGGVSVGDYDHTRPVLESLGVTELFWKIAQKPGKPMYAGFKNNCLILGLPGNPFSVFSCYHQYVRSVLGLMSGFEAKKQSLFFPAAANIKRDETRHLFLKGELVSNNGVSCVKVLKGQGSHLLQSLVLTDCLISIPPGLDLIEAGNPVEVTLL